MHKQNSVRMWPAQPNGERTSSEPSLKEFKRWQVSSKRRSFKIWAEVTTLHTFMSFYLWSRVPNMILNISNHIWSSFKKRLSFYWCLVRPRFVMSLWELWESSVPGITPWSQFLSLWSSALLLVMEPSSSHQKSQQIPLQWLPDSSTNI